jgi:hypothetical protein
MSDNRLANGEQQQDRRRCEHNSSKHRMPMWLAASLLAGAQWQQKQAGGTGRAGRFLDQLVIALGTRYLPCVAARSGVPRLSPSVSHITADRHAVANRIFNHSPD